MKRIISFILVASLCLCVSYIPVCAEDAYLDAFSETGIEYNQYFTTSDIEGETTNKVSLNNGSIGFNKEGWAAYKVDFGSDGARMITFNYSVRNDYAGATFSVFLDSTSSTPVFTYVTVGTGEKWNIYEDREFMLDAPITGQHIVYLHGSKSGTGNFTQFGFKKAYSKITAPALTLYDSENIPTQDFASAAAITSKASILNYAPDGINASLVLVPYTNSFKRISPIMVDVETNINSKTTPAEPTVSKELAGIDASSVFFTALLDNDFGPLAASAFYNAPEATALTHTSEKVIDYYIDGTSVTLYGSLADSSTKTLLGIRKSDVSKNAYGGYEFIYETAVTEGKYEHTFVMDDDTPTGTYTAIFTSDGGSSNEVTFHYSRPLDVVDAFAEINASVLPSDDDTVLTEIDNELDQWKETLGIAEKLNYINAAEEEKWIYTQIHGYLPFVDLNALNNAIDKAIFLHKINTTDDDVTTLEEYKTVIGLNEVDYYKKYFQSVDKGVLKNKLNAVLENELPLTDTNRFNELFRQAIALSKMSNHVSWGSIDEAIGDFELVLDTTYTTDYKALDDDWRKVAATEFLYKDFSSVEEIVDLLESAYALAVSAKNEAEAEEKEEEKNNNHPSGGGGGGGGGGGKRLEVEIPEIKLPVQEETVPVEPEKIISFSDLDGYEWAEDAVIYLAENEIISGKSENHYYPADNISREEFVKILVLALGVADDNAVSSFTDVPSDAWYTPYIAAAYNKGWVNGYEDGSFGIGESITREQMATMFYRAITDVDGATDVVNSTVSFTDYGQISAYASDAVMSLAKAEHMNGVGMGMFQPKRTATRAETAVLVYTYLINR